MGPQPACRRSCGSIGHWARETEIKSVSFFNLFGLATISASRAEGPMGPLLRGRQGCPNRGRARVRANLDMGISFQTWPRTGVTPLPRRDPGQKPPIFLDPQPPDPGISLFQKSDFN